MFSCFFYDFENTAFDFDVVPNKHIGDTVFWNSAVKCVENVDEVQDIVWGCKP